MRGSVLLTLLLAVLLGPPAAAAVPPSRDAGLCADAIRRVEASRTLPRGLLTAVGLSESGRTEAGSGTFAPWPWTVNNAGDGRYFPSKAEAVAWVEELRRAGRKNIDVGCMQVNLMHHPDAFADLGEALDPVANVGYGARFLASLREETGSWDRAVERYHTAEPERGGAYRARVYAHWGGGGGGGAAAAPRPASRVAAFQPPAAGVPTRGLVRTGLAPRFLPLVYAGRRAAPADAAGATTPRPVPPRPPRRAKPPAPAAEEAGTPAPVAGRFLPGAVGPFGAAPPRQPRRASSGSLLEPAPGRIAFLTGGFAAPARHSPVRPAARARASPD